MQLCDCWMQSLADDERTAEGSCGPASMLANRAVPADGEGGARHIRVDASTQTGGGVTHVNKRTAVYRPQDGSVLVVVSRGSPNAAVLAQHHALHLSTAGRRHGTMALRWVLASHHPDPVCRPSTLEQLDQDMTAMTVLAG